MSFFASRAPSAATLPTLEQAFAHRLRIGLAVAALILILSLLR
jgi:hypothetical protein